MDTKLLTYTVCILSGVFAGPGIPISEGYYWREYNGEIPHDAFPGGTQVGAERTYIGQTVRSENLIPGEIRQDTKELYYELGGPQVANKYNVKILCTQDPNKYHWVKTSIEKMKNLNRNHLVVGGYEGLFLYIGRANIGGETAIGKINLGYVLPSHTALWIAHKGQNPHFYDNFEVLMYNPSYTKVYKQNDTVTKVVNINIINC